jgi:hypothetical protein
MFPLMTLKFILEILINRDGGWYEDRNLGERGHVVLEFIKAQGLLDRDFKMLREKGSRDS